MHEIGDTCRESTWELVFVHRHDLQVGSLTEYKYSGFVRASDLCYFAVAPRCLFRWSIWRLPLGFLFRGGVHGRVTSNDAVRGATAKCTPTNERDRRPR